MAEVTRSDVHLKPRNQFDDLQEENHFRNDKPNTAIFSQHKRLLKINDYEKHFKTYQSFMKEKKVFKMPMNRVYSYFIKLWLVWYTELWKYRYGKQLK